MMKIDRLGFRRDGHTNDGDTMVALVQSVARIAAAAVTDVTDNSGGTADATAPYVVTAPAAAVAAANSGSNLADKTTTEAALNLVKDALLELATKANAAAAAVSADALTYNGGGTAADGTIAAIPATVTGAATGCAETQYNATIAALNVGLASVVGLVNRLSYAVGRRKVTITGASAIYANPAPAITVAGGTAASPGVTKAKADADLVLYRNAVATLAARINACTAAAVMDIVVTP